MKGLILECIETYKEKIQGPNRYMNGDIHKMQYCAMKRNDLQLHDLVKSRGCDAEQKEANKRVYIMWTI